MDLVMGRSADSSTIYENSKTYDKLKLRTVIAKRNISSRISSYNNSRPATKGQPFSKMISKEQCYTQLNRSMIDLKKKLLEFTLNKRTKQMIYEHFGIIGKIKGFEIDPTIVIKKENIVN